MYPYICSSILLCVRVNYIIIIFIIIIIIIIIMIMIMIMMGIAYFQCKNKKQLYNHLIVFRIMCFWIADTLQRSDNRVIRKTIKRLYNRFLFLY